MKRILVVGDKSSLAKVPVNGDQCSLELVGTLEEAALRRNTGACDEVFVDSDLLARLGMQLLPSVQDALHDSSGVPQSHETRPHSDSLEAVLDCATIGIAILDGSSLRAKRANPAYLQFLEEPHRSRGITGLHPHDFIPFAQESGVVGLMEKVARTGEAYTNPEYEHIGFERGTTYWRYSLLPISAERQGTCDVMILASEITDQVFSRKCIEKMAERSVANLAQLQAIMRSMTDGLVVFDLQGHVIDMNPAALHIHGFETVEQALRHLSEFSDTFELYTMDWRVVPVDEWPMGRVLKGEIFHDLQMRVRRIDKGRTWVISYGGAPVTNTDGNVSLGILTLRDVTDQKRSEEEWQAIVDLLRLGNQPQSFDDLMNTLIHCLEEWSGCGAVAVRLEQNGDYPYYVASGFTEEFVRAENSLCAFGPEGELVLDCLGNPLLECMCGNILCGRFDASKPYFTRHGSFWTNCTDELEQLIPCDSLLNGLRGRCVENFKSVALIPLKTGGETVGMIQLNDLASGRFDLRLISLLEEVSSIVASIVSRKRIEDTLQDTNERFKLLSETSSRLLVSDAPQQIVNQLCTKVMQYLDCHAFFNFLVDEEQGCLHMNACAGIPEETAKEIEWLDYGVAVCGCVARDGCRIVAENIMDTPDVRTELVKSFGIQAYACHPLLGQGGKTIGTLSFGTRSRPSFTPDELALMKTVADQVAIAMERIRLLQAEQRRAAELESFIASMADGVILFDAQGRPVFMNDAGKEIADVKDDSLGLDGYTLYTLDGEMVPDAEKPLARALRGEYVRDVRFKAVNKHREWVCSITSSPVKDSEDRIVGATKTFRDQTDRVTFERQRQELYEREHHIAEVLQQALIPPQMAYNIPGYMVAVRYQPALREAEIGGDFYDIFELGDGRIGILIGDVAGKGLGAAMRVAAARYAIRSYAYLDASPGVVMTLANEALCRDHVGVTGMLTAFYAVVDTRKSTLTYSNGGHEPPLLQDAAGCIHELSLSGRALGIMGGFTYNEASRLIQPGDTLVMFTDGITEARVGGVELFGGEGVVEFLERAQDSRPDSIASGLLSAASRYAGGSLQDDAAVVVLKLEEGMKRSSVVRKVFSHEINDSARDLPKCRTATVEIAASMGFTEQEVGNIACAVFEACANAVVHGNKGSCSPVLFKICAYDDRMEAVVKDSGDGFTCPVVSPIPPPTSYRGRGIPLMRVYMDDVRIESNGGCQVTLIKYLPGHR